MIENLVGGLMDDDAEELIMKEGRRGDDVRFTFMEHREESFIE